MKCIVVGSGPSGVHFAETLLGMGHEVVMLDVGYARGPVEAPTASFDELKRIPDPTRFFLGDAFQSVTMPGGKGEYYGLPPSQDFVLAENPYHQVRESGFASLHSFAQGGLAEAWTGGVYPFNAAELADFPFGAADLAPHYHEVARRIGIAAEADDLECFMPLPDPREAVLRLDVHSDLLFATYRRHRAALNAAGCYVGRSRLAVITQPRDGRGACDYLGRCLFGCPHAALYTPAATLRRLMGRPGFSYQPGVFVSHCTWDATRRVTGVVVRRGGSEEAVRGDAVALAAGALGSARIMLDSVYRATGEVLVLPGLMDNQQILVPFVNLGMLGKVPDPRSYQYHQVCMGFAGADPRHYVHAQLTTLKTAMAHPVIQSLPVDLGSGTMIFRLLRGALGVANVNLHDTRRDDCTVTIEPRPEGPSTLVSTYRPAPDDDRVIAEARSRMTGALRRLGCIVPPGMAHVRPKGASVHYAGLIPMGKAAAPLSATPEGKSRDVEGLYFADGVTFPFLPAKNITFTLMANAVRVATAAVA